MSADLPGRYRPTPPFATNAVDQLVVANRLAELRGELRRRDAAVARIQHDRHQQADADRAELLRRAAECRQRRASGTCPGRCVLGGQPDGPLDRQR